ncbi:MAG: cobalamin B12-binding domain-containing protein [Burkholderiales bacterium]|nr:cobalamin B12-binding domain-containing protein [Burkholderiales bacterium]
MNDRTSAVPITLSIAAVERDTGLSKDTLRVWERRYGFPLPARDTLGERAYPLEQVEKLRLLKRLLDAGHRPGRIVPLPLEELQSIAEQTVDQPQRGLEAALRSDDVRAHIDLVRAHDAPALRASLARLLARVGVARFVTEVVGPLNSAVGDAWLRGQLEIFEEHQYTETIQSLLRQAIAGLPPPAAGAAPRVLLGTFPGEPHGLGLLMAEALLTLEGCHCVSLGVQTPLWDLVLAAGAYRADIVGLSFTGCTSPNQIVDGLTELRAKLPPLIGLWAGGSAPVLHRRALAGVEPFAAMDGLPAAVQRWRAARVTWHDPVKRVP